jgi:hypothetical protein
MLNLSWDASQWCNLWNLGGGGKKKQWVLSHFGLAIHINNYFKAKEELWKLKYNISPCKKYNLQNNLLNKPKSFKVL